MRDLITGARRPWARLLVLGAALWLVQGLFTGPSRDQIVVSEDVLRGLRQDHRRRTGSLPDAAQEAALVQAYVDDEILYREARALALDKGDVVVRRRMVQNMEFLLEESSPIPAPSDADLEAHLAAHPERFTVAQRISLEHVFVRREGTRREPEGVARELRQRLVAGEDPGRLGDPFPRGARMIERTPRELDQVFGSGFAAGLEGLPLESWSEPLASSFGLHLVRLSGREAAHLPSLATARAAVLWDWRQERRDEADREAMARLRDRYQVVTEGGAPGTAAAQAATGAATRPAS